MTVLTQLAAAIRAYDRAFGYDEHLVACGDCGATWRGYTSDACHWCLYARHRHAKDVLTPPAPRGYGYATDDDLHTLGYDPAGERRRDLERWRQDLNAAVQFGTISTTEGEQAWESANRKASTSSTGTSSTNASTATKRSSPDWPTKADGRRSPHKRKRENPPSC